MRVATSVNTSIYDFNCLTINGVRLPLAELRGQVMLIVNTASYCGFTPQFKGLDYLYRRYRDKGFVVLGFPCNQFGYQDPKSNDKISEFCIRNYGVSFPMFARVKVNGRDAEPLFRHIKPLARGLLGTAFIKWNFTKFLVDRDGQVVRRFGTTSLPRNLAGPIEELLS